MGTQVFLVRVRQGALYFRLWVMLRFDDRMRPQTMTKDYTCVGSSNKNQVRFNCGNAGKIVNLFEDSICQGCLRGGEELLDPFGVSGLARGDGLLPGFGFRGWFEFFR